MRVHRVCRPRFLRRVSSLSTDNRIGNPIDRRCGNEMIDNAYSKDNTKLGFIGLGLMGSRFLRRLNAEGWDVRGWNRSRAATVPLKKYGFAIDDTLGDLVRKSDVLLSSLANDDAVRATYLGEDGVFAH